MGHFVGIEGLVPPTDCPHVQNLRVDSHVGAIKITLHEGLHSDFLAQMLNKGIKHVLKFI